MILWLFEKDPEALKLEIEFSQLILIRSLLKEEIDSRSEIWENLFKKAQVANLWRNQLNLEITLIPRIGRKGNERINHYDQ
jgi:hypothetical protein